jgi:formylglycine-generating enzyme required for sulfatase activity
LPFDSDDAGSLREAIKSETPDPISRLPANVNAALIKGLSKERDQRYPTCRQLLNALSEAVDQEANAGNEEVQEGSTRVVATVARPTLSDEGSRAGEERDDNGLKMKFVWCPPGQFTMGSPETEQGRGDDEDQVQVKLTKGFWIGKYDVTQGEWERVMGTTPWKGEEYVKEGSRYAATYVSWQDATEFVAKLTTQERQAGRLPVGWRYTLPTEAQWEYACRAGTQTAYGFGDDASRLSDYAWVEDNADYANEEYAHEVGLKMPNAWGLYDTHGNVWEWCRDWYQQTMPGGVDPEQTTQASRRVLRGGSWFHPPVDCRSAGRLRFYGGPGFRISYVGFRVVRSSEQ